MSTDYDQLRQLCELHGDEYAFYLWNKGISLGNAMAKAQERQDGGKVPPQIVTVEALEALAEPVKPIEISEEEFQLFYLKRNANLMSPDQVKKELAATKGSETEQSKTANLSDSEELNSVDLSDCSDSELISFGTFSESDDQLPVSEPSKVESIKLPERVYTRADLADSSSSDSEDFDSVSPNPSKALFDLRVKNSKTTELRQRKPIYSDLVNDPKSSNVPKPSDTNKDEVPNCCQKIANYFYNK